MCVVRKRVEKQIGQDMPREVVRAGGHWRGEHEPLRIDSLRVGIASQVVMPAA
jgi:hypothetical protein